MKSLNKDFLPVYTADQVYTKGQVDELIAGAGGASGIFIVHPLDDGENYYLDKNFSEISGAVESGSVPFLVEIRDNGSALITVIGYYYIEDGTYYVQVDQETVYSSDSATGTLIAV